MCHKQFAHTARSTQEWTSTMKKVLSMICEWCGKTFLPRRTNMIYCNENCRSSHNQDKYLRLTKKVKRNALNEHQKQKRIVFWTEELKNVWQ